MKILDHVARGSEYLVRPIHSAVQSLNNNNGYVHRDLAARNILVSHRDLTHPDLLCKVNDFGLTRPMQRVDIQVRRSTSCTSDTSGTSVVKTRAYVQTKEEKVPLKWMAPETYFRGKPVYFTEKSEVFSFAITAWEVLTNGASPDLAKKNLKHGEMVLNGKRLKIPDFAGNDTGNDTEFVPLELHELIQQSWDNETTKRPTFNEIIEKISKIKI